MISEIVFKGIPEFESFQTAEEDSTIKNLSKVNLFIGSNNSGKSRCIRGIFANQAVGINHDGFNLISLNEAIQDYEQEMTKLFQKYGATFNRSPNRQFHIEKIYATQVGGEHLLEKLVKKVDSYTSKSFNVIPDVEYGMRSLFSSKGMEILSRLKESYQDSFSKVQYFNGKYVYIPMLRGVRPLNTGTGENDYYLDRTIKDYFTNGLAQDRQMYTGMSLYNDLVTLLLGDTSDRRRVRDFESFLSDTFFQNLEVNLIPRHGQDVVYIKIGNTEKPVYELGDGIQSVIILLYPLFFNTDKQLLVFFEEPEHSLHPGYQRLFIEALHRPEFSKFQYFVTTHSNHLLDITEEVDKDISVYTVERVGEGNEAYSKITNVSKRDLRTLELLGVRNSSVFLSNCTIWVEGITDRLYIKRFLEIYQDYLLNAGEIKQRFTEDIHFAFVEYAGSNVTHWSFETDKDIEKINALSISNKIFLVADKDDTEDKPESAKALRLKKLGEVLKNNFYRHDGREMENTLLPDVLLRTIAEKEKKEKEVIAPKGLEYEKYKNERIGKYLQGKLKDISFNYEGEGGTINDKKGFCKRAIEQIRTIDDLSDENKELCKRLMAFIQQSNNTN